MALALKTGGAASPPLCPARHPPQSVAACLSRAARRILSHGNQVSRDHLRRFDPGCRRTSSRGAQDRRPFGLRGVEQAHAGFSGAGTAVSCTGRRDQCRIWLSRSEMSWLQHAPDRCARHRAATEGDADPCARAIHAMQGLLTASRATVQAQPSGRTATDEDFRKRSAVNMVAGRTVRNGLA